jgi:hypothetical protein
MTYHGKIEGKSLSAEQVAKLNAIGMSWSIAYSGGRRNRQVDEAAV